MKIICDKNRWHSCGNKMSKIVDGEMITPTVAYGLSFRISGPGRVLKLAVKDDPIQKLAIYVGRPSVTHLQKRSSVLDMFLPLRDPREKKYNTILKRRFYLELMLPGRIRPKLSTM